MRGTHPNGRLLLAGVLGIGVGLGGCESPRERALERRAERIEDQAERHPMGSIPQERLEQRADRLEDLADEIPNVGTVGRGTAVPVPAHETPAPPARGGGPEAEPVVRDVVVLVTTPDPASLAGRSVEINDVRVRRVVGDRTFFVGGESPEQQTLVVLNEQPTPNTAVEGRYDVQAGQTLSIRGQVQRMPSPDQARRQWGLRGVSNAKLRNAPIYIEADQLEIRQQ